MASSTTTSANSGLEFRELHEVSELIRSGRLSSRAATEAMFDRIDELDPHLLSFVTLMRESALAAADDLDERLARGDWLGPLHGVPLAIKDLAYTHDAPTGAGTTIHADFQPDFDATVVARLRAAGAVILGKLRLTEGAFTGHHPDLPTPVNPWEPNTWSGVSSSGSGVATAAGLCYGSLGSDTGGSIRLPSSANGVTGLKSTWGRVSRNGIFPLAPSLDHIGPMTRSARDAAIILEAIAGHDPNDPTSALEPVPRYSLQLRLETTPVVGFDRELAAEHFDDVTNEMLESTIEVLLDLGWRVLDVRTPGFAEAAQEWTALCGIETAGVHAENYPSRSAEYGPDLAGLIEIGRGLSAIDYHELLESRRAFTGRMRALMSDIDLLLLPGIGAASPTISQMENLGSDAELFAGVTIPTAPIDNCGMPSITLPAGFTERGTPLAAQFVAGDFKEGLLLAAGHTFQQATDFHRQHPHIVAV
ncbi:amidase [Brevibacterium aurantiacum]|uniref:Amidase n=1 Tax=Brevibacterium aurantiacum TaxID=273384 RepID=A0A2A3YRB0_BREAU|nr:amidase [Brevibacterium aurantiacum]AZL04939.1 amidase [Brevibacterium aurantiacum]AZL08529.1 amidase [Brevibacterium aurantiacum]AZL12137.1 amidase [Brevibacterium aurantiacum]PCC19012.1 Asp-tRNA(Asn)/Glu-tRNA(Gln) amidotransferase GatCAB subunit A [Brevibacterium aurantiacum]PCC41794.1 Asp-tRNA(Asn)/Glu-tRNA(Gln) amidotransferase GatCAB subunit A [Brevibacterium aurantiacum]